MKSSSSKTAVLPTRYLAALRACLDRRSGTIGKDAKKLGQAALTNGLSTLDLAKMHKQALLVLDAAHDLGSRGSGASRQAGRFFSQALMPLETDRRVTRKSNQRLLQRNETLRKNTAALATANRQLKREVARRQSGEVKIERAKERYLRLFLESQVTQDKLRQLTRQILSVQEDERKKISRELHDEVVQTLVGINVELSALGRGVPAGADALLRKISRTQRLVEHSVNAVHRFARELRPAVLDDLGLIPALHAHGQNLAARRKLRIQITAFHGVEALSISKRTVLFRVAQEALNNVARHAQATVVVVTIAQIPRGIRMEVSDNGKSFPVGETLLAKNNKRLGLIGMKERIEMIGGRISIDSAPGRGTTIRTEVPFKLEPTNS